MLSEKVCLSCWKEDCGSDYSPGHAKEVKRFFTKGIIFCPYKLGWYEITSIPLHCKYKLEHIINK